MAIANAHWQHLHRHPLVQGQLGQPGQARHQPQRFVSLLDAALGEDHQLLLGLEQLDGQAEGGGARPAGIDREAAQPLQEPALQAGHLINRDHEAAIAARAAPASRMGQQQGIPSGPVGGSQKHRPLPGEMVSAQHSELSEEQGQGQILGHHHGQRPQDGVDGHVRAGAPAAEPRLGGHGRGELRRHAPWEGFQGPVVAGAGGSQVRGQDHPPRPTEGS